MKKIFYLLTILIISALVFCFTACDNGNGGQRQDSIEYTVTYYDGDTVLETRKVEKGGEIPVFTPTKEGHRFAGWFFKDGTGISGATVQSDSSVYARWNRLYTLTLNYGKGIPQKKVEAVAGESVTLPESVRAEDGSALVFWTDGSKEYRPGSVFVMPSINTALDAEWAVLVTVTYSYNGQEITSEVAKGTTVTLPDDILSADGKKVYSWTDGNEIYLAGAEIEITKNTVFIAMWSGTYTITYDVDGGQNIPSVSKNSGEEVILPLPEREGYVFLGWQIGNSTYPAGATVTVGASDITARAIWEKITFEVTLTDWDGHPIEVLEVGYGEDAVLPRLPITEIAEFAGWSAEGKNVLGNITIKATYNYETPANAELYIFTQVEGGYALSAGDASLLNDTEIILPASYRGLPVVAVADSSSSTVTTLKGFDKVEKITLTSTYGRLGARAFRSLPNLTAVILNSGLKEIGNDCFYCCYKLTSLQLNEGLEKIGSRAFYDVGVADYYIPSTVKSIEGLAFFYYPSDNLDPKTSYKSITVAQGNESYASVDGVLYSKDMTTLVCYPANKEGQSFTVPSTVTTFGTYCFSYARNIKEFSFGESQVKTIERLAFNSTVFDIVLPDSVTEITDEMLNLAFGNLTLSNTIQVIPSFAFQSFYGKNVYIPATVETLDEYAFYRSPGIENVYFADDCKVTQIPDYCFEDCAKLKLVKLHEGVKEIGAYAFSVATIGTNTNQISEITFPASLEKIGDYAFSYCGSLVSVNFASGSKIKQISTGAFGSCYKLERVTFGNTDKSVDLELGMRAFTMCDRLVTFDFPENLVSIGDECFGGSDSSVYGQYYVKITQVVLPARVRTVGNGAFSLAKRLESFTTAEGSVLETVGSSVFYNCEKLETVILPASLRHMGSNVFAGCTSLENVQILSNTMNFEFVDGGLYNTETHVLEFAKVGEDGVFTVKEGTVAIVDSCFNNVSALKVINIASTVKSIGVRAFYKCVNLTEVNIPENSVLESIGDYAFAMGDETGYMQFTEIYFPKTLKSIGSNAFFRSSLNIPLEFYAELEVLDGYAFAYSPNIPSVTFAKNSKLTTIGASAFYRCTSLTSVVFGEGSSLTSMAAIVFNGCTKLETVVLTSESVVTLGNNVFPNNAPDLSIYVPDSLVTSYINGTGWSNYRTKLKPISQYYTSII